MFNFIKNISSTEIILIAVILLVLFGAKVMTRLARTSGETLREMKKVKNEFTQAVEGDDNKPGKN